MAEQGAAGKDTPCIACGVMRRGGKHQAARRPSLKRVTGPAFLGSANNASEIRALRLRN